MTARDLDRLEEKLGHRFDDKKLLTLALTHASAVNGSGREKQTYQRLEFLGDRVLGLVIADLLVEKFPDALEGELSRRLARLVSRETCVEIAREMELSEHLRVGGGVRKKAEPITPGVLADVCEAVIAAVYRDGGLEAARALVTQFWGPRVAGMSGSLRDAKTELQEWAHRRGAEGPVYLEVQRSGPDHKPKFEVEVAVPGVSPERGRGGSKREAEHEAAASLLRREGVWEKV